MNENGPTVKAMVIITTCTLAYVLSRKNKRERKLAFFLLQIWFLIYFWCKVITRRSVSAAGLALKLLLDVYSTWSQTLHAQHCDLTNLIAEASESMPQQTVEKFEAKFSQAYFTSYQ